MRRRPYKSRDYKTPKLSHWQKGMLRAAADRMPTPLEAKATARSWQFQYSFKLACRAAKVEDTLGGLLVAAEWMRKSSFERRDGVVVITPGNRSRLSSLAD